MGVLRFGFAVVEEFFPEPSVLYGSDGSFDRLQRLRGVLGQPKNRRTFQRKLLLAWSGICRCSASVV